LGQIKMIFFAKLPFSFQKNNKNVQNSIILLPRAVCIFSALNAFAMHYPQNVF